MLDFGLYGDPADSTSNDDVTLALAGCCWDSAAEEKGSRQQQQGDDQEGAKCLTDREVAVLRKHGVDVVTEQSQGDARSELCARDGMEKGEDEEDEEEEEEAGDCWGGLMADSTAAFLW